MCIYIYIYHHFIQDIDRSSFTCPGMLRSFRLPYVAAMMLHSVEHHVKGDAPRNSPACNVWWEPSVEAKNWISWAMKMCRVRLGWGSMSHRPGLALARSCAKKLQRHVGAQFFGLCLEASGCWWCDRKVIGAPEASNRGWSIDTLWIIYGESMDNYPWIIHG